MTCIPGKNGLFGLEATQGWEHDNSIVIYRWTISLTQVTTKVPKPMTWSLRAAPCFLAHEETNVPAPQWETQSFLLSLHHGICPHMLVSCRHIWFIPTCFSKNYIEGKCKFTKCPAGSDAYDCGSHILTGFMAWNEEGEMKNCDWQVCKQGHGKVL